MVQDINIFIAFAAGLVSFLSPCVLPLVPGYISFIGGQGLGELRENKKPRPALMLRTLGFVSGFALVFVLMGVLFSGTAMAFSGASRWITIGAGVIVVLFGLNLIFNFIQFLNYEKRFHVQNKPAGFAGSLLLGMAFAAGWSPCIGPILTSILVMAAGSSSVVTGIALLGIYSLGLGLPFLITSLFISQAEGVLEKIKPHMPLIQKTSGIILIFVGTLMIFGQYRQMTNWLLSAGFRLRAWYAQNMLAGKIIFTALFAALGTAILLPLRTMLKKEKAVDQKRNEPGQHSWIPRTIFAAIEGNRTQWIPGTKRQKTGATS